ncbi:WD repeat-containing protein 25 [Phalaenopsis equestris]|uniref:WD repeat-containing protein 25 n=1 Tax=Phalaenopsis equestris TaxID=78828 RepID=UPI0009E6408A|nr:WD repeat-containing protein 25 [Phalaenopsis equestris]
MDLLCRAYANASDDDEEEKDPHPIFPAKKRRLDGRSLHHVPFSQTNRQGFLSSGEPGQVPLVAGRYVSKRERAIFSATSMPTDSLPPVITPPGSSHLSNVGTLSDADLPSVLKSLLKNRGKSYAHGNNTSGNFSLTFKGHSKAINSIQWSYNHGHLLASAGMDHSVLVWNVWSKAQKKVCTFSHHKAAVTDVRWCSQGLCLLSCGYDCSSRLIDVEKGVEKQQFKEDQVVQSIKLHTTNSNLFLSGGSKGFLRLWDMRAKKAVHEYLKHLGPILDVEFSVDGKNFIASTDTSRSNISENTIIIWDVSRQIPLSNQVYAEAFTCPCIRYHPSDSCFVAQSNGNYIAIFSAKSPFRLDRYRRYESHGVWGFPIKCNFSLDGKEIVTGSSDGSIYFYDYTSSELIRKIKAFEEPCVDVAFHPSVPNLVAACSWDGEISVFD